MNRLCLFLSFFCFSQAFSGQTIEIHPEFEWGTCALTQIKDIYYRIEIERMHIYGENYKYTIEKPTNTYYIYNFEEKLDHQVKAIPFSNCWGADDYKFPHCIEIYDSEDLLIGTINCEYSFSLGSKATLTICDSDNSPIAIAYLFKQESHTSFQNSSVLDLVYSYLHDIFPIYTPTSADWTFSIVDFEDESVEIAQFKKIFKNTYFSDQDYYWEINLLESNKIDFRILNIFSAFVCEAFWKPPSWSEISPPDG